MSRIGKQPIELPAGVTVEVNGNIVKVKGPKGELTQEIRDEVALQIGGKEIVVTRKDESIASRSLHGLTRSLVANMVEGVTKGFTKQLEIIGVGYRAQTSGSKITLQLGFSHPIEFVAPSDIQLSQDEKNKNLITVSGIDKQKVGEVAAKIRSYRKPEPYKGKGIKYVGEYVARKAGKTSGSK